MSALPETCSLAEKYLKPQEEEYFVGLPFWEMETRYDSLAQVPVGEKGNTCVGCQPGSGPGPFIVVYNDDNKMGFIYPYVTVIDREEPKSEQMSVETTATFLFPGEKIKKQKASVKVQVNGDTTQKTLDFKKVSPIYNIEYVTHEEMQILMKQMCCYNFGSFGNCALPNHTDPIHLDGYFAY